RTQNGSPRMQGAPVSWGLCVPLVSRGSLRHPGGAVSTVVPERGVAFDCQSEARRMIKRLVIVGGGTAGWITAGYLARTLGAQSSEGIHITLVESADIGILGVGEGTFPSIRTTLKRIGVDETSLLRECSASFKQGAKFV